MDTHSRDPERLKAFNVSYIEPHLHMNLDYYVFTLKVFVPSMVKGEGEACLGTTNILFALLTKDAGSGFKPD
jgi:hypothetical protein